MKPRDPFPFMNHRTLAEVDRTGSLLEKKRAGFGFSRVDAFDLECLLKRAAKAGSLPDGHAA